jgi:hypothetical protein
MFDGICHSLYIVDGHQYMQQQCYQIKMTRKITQRAGYYKKKVIVAILQQAPDLYLLS